MGMRTILTGIPSYLTHLVEKLRARLGDPQFLARHRVRPEDFTRQRQLMAVSKTWGRYDGY